MKNLTSILFLLYIIFAINLVQAQQSNNNISKKTLIVKSDKPKFEITFPADYKLEESKTENSLETRLYRAVKNENVFMLKYTEHKNPAVSSDNQVYMNASLESFKNGIHADLIKKSEFKEKKEKGLEAFLKISDKDLYVFYRVLIIKHVQYQIIVITKVEDKTKEINQFFNSFHI